MNSVAFNVYFKRRKREKRKKGFCKINSKKKKKTNIWGDWGCRKNSFGLKSKGKEGGGEENVLYRVKLINKINGGHGGKRGVRWENYKKKKKKVHIPEYICPYHAFYLSYLS